MRVLIVDDDVARARSLSAHLASAGVVAEQSVVAVDCVHSARAAMRNQYFDVVVLDVILPARSGETPDASVGMSLLQQMSRERGLKRPERIIGITANIGDLSSFRAVFEESCNIVIPAGASSAAWRDRVAESLRYVSGSKVDRKAVDKELALFTIHGIRTYGQWQRSLEAAVERVTDRCSVHSYQYGYFSAFALLLPWARNRELSRLIGRVRSEVGSGHPRRLLIFAHSFGTFLAVKALEEVVGDAASGTEIVLVLCGSVLPEDYDWSAIQRTGKVKVVNECGTKDYVLWFSKAFVIGLGMAGKVGFRGFNGSRFTNRYHSGGHSLYFSEPGFAESYWLPMFTGDEVAAVDSRSTLGSLDPILDGFFSFVGRLKLPIYASAIIGGGVGIFALVT